MQAQALPPHAHGHDHHHDAALLPEKRLQAALAITLAFMGVEVVAGWLSQSLALLSDSGHMLADAGALALALAAQHIAAQPRTQVRTYGFRRAETLAAFANGIALGVTAVWIIVEAVQRWSDPPHVHGGWMLGVAACGLVVNLAAAAILSRGSEHNANTRAAMAHVLADAAGSVAAMVAGILVLAFGWERADPLVSGIIALLILWSAWKLIWRTAEVLMEGIPRGLEVANLEATIRQTPGVADLHDLHAWTISEGFDVVTVHVVLDGSRHGTEVAREVGARVRHAHHIEHVTVQPEPPPMAVHVQRLPLQRRRADDL